MHNTVIQLPAYLDQRSSQRLQDRFPLSLHLVDPWRVCEHFLGCVPHHRSQSVVIRDHNLCSRAESETLQTLRTQATGISPPGLPCCCLRATATLCGAGLGG